MLHLTIKNLLASRLRFAMTSFAVMLAVAFVVSSFVVADGARAVFGSLSEEIVGGTDLEVRAQDQGVKIDQDLLQSVAAVDGVRTVSPVVTGGYNAVRPVNAEGQGIASDGPPQIMMGWPRDTSLSSLKLVEGSAPVGDDEFVMDLDSAAKHRFLPGETYRIVTSEGPLDMTLTGTFTFGQNNDTVGATLMAMPPDALVTLLDLDGYDSIGVGLEDPDQVDQVGAVIANIASGLEIAVQADLVAETKQEFNEEVDIIGNVLLGFAGVSLFVSVFVIYNTFSIVLGQRTRELALLRVVGADSGQLQRSMLGEALLIGVLASAAGVGAGVLLAKGLVALFNALGAQFPDLPTVLASRTIGIGMIVGVLTTLVAALVPAFKASRVPAMAALRDGLGATEGRPRRRLAAGATLMVIGLAAGGAGLGGQWSTSSVITLLAVAGTTIFIGTSMLSPLVAGPVTRLLGTPAKAIGGVAGHLAQNNSARDPRRTATTASALMIGLGLISMVLVVGQSIKVHFRQTLAEVVQADFIVSDTGAGQPFPPTLAADLERLDETSVVVSLSSAPAVIDQLDMTIASMNLADASSVLDLDITDGAAYEPSVSNGVLVAQSEAERSGLKVGDTVTINLDEATAEVEVIATFGNETFVQEPFVVDHRVWAGLGGDEANDWLLVNLDDGIDATQADTVFAEVRAGYPHASFQTSEQLLDQGEQMIDQALAVVNAMVALAVVIALMGIANTLALSVIERTRELGLLRAVGLSRPQAQQMIMMEATLIALFGAVLGVGLGVGLGWMTTLALPDSIIGSVSVPVGSMIVLVVLAGLASLVAALGPARRAAKLDVLAAIVGP